VRRATVCRFAQCTGCENSRNAVHDAVSRWVATRHVCYFAAAPVSAFSRRIFLLPAASSLGSSFSHRRPATRNDIHPVQINPNMLTLRFLRREWTRGQRQTGCPADSMSSFRDPVSPFLFLFGANSRDAAWSRIQFHELRNITRHASRYRKRTRTKEKRNNERKERTPLMIRNSRGGTLSRGWAYRMRM